MENRSAAALWQSFKSRSQNVPDHYEAWAFGNTEEMADELAELVLAGKKTATSSNYTLYELEQEPLPKVGQHHVLLNGKGEAVAVIMTTAVTVIPYNQVTEEHAFLEGEGEGDRSLAYWQDVHEPFFTQELETHGLAFHPEIPVLCEQFKVVYRR